MIRGHKYFFSIALACLILQAGCATTSTTTNTTETVAGSWLQWPQPPEMPSTLDHAIRDMAAGKIQQAESGLTMAVRAAEPAADYLYAECAALKGDLPLAASRFIDFIANHADSSLVAPALARLRTIDALSVSLLDWDKVLALRVSNPYAAARLVTLQSSAIKNSPDKAQLVHPTAVPLVHFHWVGPFSPNVYSDFDKHLVFDDDPILAKEYTVEGQKHTQFKYYPDYIMPFVATQNGIYVGETQIQTDREAELNIIGRAGIPYRLYVDGKLVLENKTLKAESDKKLSEVVKLSSGTHVVRLRMGFIKKTAPAFWIQQNPATEKDGQAVTITENPDITVTSVNPGQVTLIRRYDISDVVGSKIDPVPSVPLHTWLGAMTAIADNEAQIAEVLLQSRLEADPDDSVAKYLRALRYRADSDIEPSILSENVISLLKEVEESSPEIGHAHLLLMREFLSQKQPKQALETYKTYRSYIPDNADTDYILSEISQALDWSDIAAEYEIKAAKKDPNSCTLAKKALDAQNLIHEYTAYDDLSPKAQSCAAVIRTYAKREGDDIRDAQRWQNAMLKLAENYPNDTQLKIDALNIKVLNDPQAAAAEMSDHLDRVNSGFYPIPSSDNMLRFIDRLRAAGYTAEASKILNKLIDLSPVDESYQNLYLRLNDQKPFESLRIDGMKTIRDYLALNRTEAGHSVTILDYAATHIYPNGAKLGLTHIISRVLSKEGKNVSGEIYLPRNAAVLKLHTIKSDTFEKIEPEAIDFKNSVTAPNLAIGDFIEVEYLTFDPPMTSFTNRAITDMFYYGSDQSPIVHSEYVFEYPSDWQVDIVESGPENAITRNCSQVGGYTRCSAYVDDIPVLITEPNSASALDIIPNITVYNRYGWEVVQSGLYESAVRQTRQTPYIDHFYDQIKLPDTNSTWEKARAIYEYVIDRIDENQSGNSGNEETATKTVTRGTGSRAITLKALYDKAGFKSYFGYVRSVLAPKKIDKLPSYSSLGYTPMLIVETEKGPAYVQPTEDFFPFDYLSSDSQNMEVIPLQPDLPRFTSRRDNIDDMRGTIDITYQIADDGSAKAVGIETMKGTRSLVMRNFLNVVKNDKTRMHQILQNSLANSYGRISLTRLEHENLDDKYKALVLNYDFDIASFAAISDDELKIQTRIYAYNLAKQFASIAVNERRSPLLVETEVLSDRKLTFHAPAGYQWNSATLNDITIESKFGKFSRQMQNDGRTLQVREQIEMLPQYIELSDYAEFREFCLAVDEAQRTVISAKK